MNDGDVEVEIFVVVAVVASVDAECVVPSFSKEDPATFVAKSQKNYCSHCWKLWLIIPEMVSKPRLTKVSFGDTQMMLLVSPFPFPS